SLVAVRLVRHVDDRRHGDRARALPRLPSLDGRLLLGVSRSAQRRRPGVRPERGGEPEGARAVRARAVGALALLLCALWHAARSYRLRAALGGGAASRSLGRAAYVHGHAALR